MKYVGYTLAGIVWFSVVFLVGLWLTFPDEAVAERVMFEWQKNLGDSTRLQVASVRPALVGVRASEVTVFGVDKPRGGRAQEEEPTVSEMIAFDQVKVKTSVMSLLAREPHVWGQARMGDGDLDFDAETGLDEDGKLVVHNVTAEAQGFPLSAVPPINDNAIDGTGTVDLKVDLEAADGLSTADGSLSLQGTDLVITSISASGMEGFDLGEIQVHDLDVVLDAVEGRARVSRGTLSSSVADVELSGDVILQDDPQRMRLRLKVVLSLSEDFAMFKSFLKSAEWSDGQYHYTVTGTVSHVRFRAERERRARSVRGPDRQPVDGGSIRERVMHTPKSHEEIEAEREERRVRREERIAARQGTDHQRPTRAGEPEGPEDEPLDDELDTEDELLDEDLDEGAGFIE